MSLFFFARNSWRAFLYQGDIMNTYKYINLFSGIGGWELGLQELPMENVLSCEIDKYARQTFTANFPDLPCIKNNQYPEDIRKINPEDIPPFDILVGSPPCQSFSMAGLRKGLKDDKDDKGNMFFYVLNIIKHRKPKAFILENVKGLLTAEGGRSFRIIHDLFRNAGYSFHYKVIKGCDCGIPQIRQRVFMVGFRGENQETSGFKFPASVPLKFTMKDVFKSKTCNREIGYTVLTAHNHKKYNEPYNWMHYIVDGVEHEITLKETQKLMGLPDSFLFPKGLSSSRIRKQLGNGIIPDCVKLVSEQVLLHLKKIS